MISSNYARNWICDFVLGKELHLEPILVDEDISRDSASN